MRKFRNKIMKDDSWIIKSDESMIKEIEEPKESNLETNDWAEDAAIVQAFVANTCNNNSQKNVNKRDISRHTIP